MNNELFLQLLKDYQSSQNLFYVDQNKTYADFILDSQKIAYAITKSNAEIQKVGLAIKDPYKAMASQLALFLLNRPFTLISFLEPLDSRIQMQKDYGLDCILSDEHVSLFLSAKETSEFTTIDIQKTGLNVLSSGSTSLSKEIFHPLLNIYLSAQNFIRFFNVNQNERFILNLPHHHVGGLLVLWRTFFSHAAFGLTDSLPSFDYISLVPLQLKRLLEDQKKIEFYRNVKAILIGGALLDKTTKEEAQKNGLSLYETYAMSETATFVMLNGEVLGENQVKLDETNHILIKSPHLSPSVHTDDQGFYHTKDLGQIIDGKIHFVSRDDLIFKSAGELIDPIAVENEIKNLSYIKNCVCVERSDYFFQKALVCFYELNNSKIDQSEIKTDLKKRLHPYQIPRDFILVESGTFIEGLKPKRHAFRKKAMMLKLNSKFNNQYIDNHQTKTLVVLHGFMEDLTDFNFLESLTEFNLLRIDLPGHGLSPIDQFTHKDEIYFYLNELIKLLTHEQTITLYGYSMGGRVALELIHAGLKIDELILESASLGFMNNEEREKRLKADLTLFEPVSNQTSDLKSFLLQWYKNPIFTGYNQTKEFSASIEKKCLHDFLNWQKALAFFSPGNSSLLFKDYYQLLENLPKIKAITGKLDKKYDELYRGILLEKWTHYSLEDVGHNPHKIVPQKILEIILI